MSKVEQERLFLPAPLFMVRAPLFSLREFNALSHSQQLDSYLQEFFSKNSSFREAIFVATPTLYQAACDSDWKEGKRRKNLCSSLLKYLLRMSTRSIPFGLFSFVATGSWSSSVDAFFDPKQLEKRARPDMEWLGKLVEWLCKQPGHYERIPVRANPLVTRSGGRLYLKYTKLEDVEGSSKQVDKKQVSIKANALTETILALSENPILPPELEQSLTLRFPGIDLARTRSTIEQLLQQQLLQPILLPSLLTRSTYDDLLKKIERHGVEPPEQLIEITQRLKHYRSGGIGEGEESLVALQRTMEQVVSSPHYLQVDTAYRGGSFHLPEELARELSQAVEAVWRICCALGEGSDLFKEYHAKFLENYGLHRTVPLLQLLEPHMLGSPELHRDSTLGQPKVEGRLSSWLKGQLMLCLAQSEREILLTHFLLDHLAPKVAREGKACLSFDLFCQLTAESKEQIEKGSYEFSLFSFSFQAGAALGRFIDLLDENTQRAIEKLAREQEQLERHCRWVELSFLPNSLRSANVATHPRSRKLWLDPTDPLAPLSLGEIYVGADEEGLYFTDREGTREFIFTSGNLLNGEMMPLPLRFLRDTCLARYQMIDLSFWGELSSTPFLPRIRYQKTILSPAQWYVTLSMLEANHDDPLEKIEGKLASWFERFKVDRCVLLVEADQRMLVDRHRHLGQIASCLKSQREVRLFEHRGGTEHSWVSSPGGAHLSELVVPFIKNPRFHTPRYRDHLPSFAPFTPAERKRVLGSDWLFIKFYMPDLDLERFVLHNLAPFARQLLENQVVKQWFFIRYKDPAHHLRVRFQGSSEQLLATLLPILHDWSCNLFDQRLISDLQFGCYDRELERYGGAGLIDSAEAFFSADSAACVDLLELLATRRLEWPSYLVAALGIIDLLHAFQRVPRVHFVAEGEALEGIRQWKGLLNCYTQWRFRDRLSDLDPLGWVESILRTRRPALERLVQKLLEGDGSDKFPSHTLAGSLIHMHCNRVLGIDPKLERKACAYAYYALDHMQKCKSQGRSHEGSSV